MRVVIAGAHGRVGRRLGRLLSARGDSVVGIVPTPEHEAELAPDSADIVVLDLEHASVDDLAAVVVNADIVVFAAGAEPAGSAPLHRRGSRITNWAASWSGDRSAFGSGDGPQVVLPYG